MRIILLVLTFIFFFWQANPALASSLVINEFMAHPSSGNKEWIEFYNPDGTDLSSYWVDDDTSFTSDSGSSAKKSLSSLNTDNNKYPFIELSSFLNNGGDYLVLFSGDGTIIDQYQYTADPGSDVTIGRTPDGGGWNTLAAASKGSSNGDTTPAPSSTTAPTAVPTSAPTSVPTSKSKSSSSSTNNPTATPKPQVTPVPTFSSTSIVKEVALTSIDTKIASIAGASNQASSSAGTEIKGSQQINLLPWLGGVLVIGGISSLIFVYLRSKKYEGI